MSPLDSDRRPRIRPEWTGIDWTLEILAFSLLVMLIATPFCSYDLLPEKIPRHFDAMGQPDAWGNRQMVWSLPIVGLVLYAGLSYINRFPHVFNYPVQLTAENAPRQYRVATRAIRALKLCVVAAFAWINFQTVRIALGESAGLGRYSLLLLIIAVFGVVGYMIYKSLKAQ